MNKVQATERVAKMLREYAANVGSRMLDDLSHPLAKIVVMRGGGVGVATTDEQPSWFSYAFTATLPGLERWKEMTELAGKGENDPLRKIQLETQTFHALTLILTNQISAEACERMLSMRNDLTIAGLPLAEDANSLQGDDEDDEDDEEPRPRVVVLFIWATFLALTHAGAQAAGIVGAVVVGGVVGLAMMKRWGAWIPNAVLLVCLPIVFVLALAATAGVKNMNKRPASPATSQVTTGQSAPVMGTTEDWDKVALAFESSHPDLKLGNNAEIMQAKVNISAGSSLPVSAILNNAYVAARLESGWVAPSISSDSATGRRYSGPRITVNFATAKIGAVMQILADVGQYDLYIDDSRGIVGSFRYVNEPSDQVAAEIAAKYSLSVEYQGKKMIVSKRY